jgi:hypothetical protein
MTTRHWLDKFWGRASRRPTLRHQPSGALRAAYSAGLRARRGFAWYTAVVRGTALLFRGDFP